MQWAMLHQIHLIHVEFLLRDGIINYDFLFFICEGTVLQLFTKLQNTTMKISTVLSAKIKIFFRTLGPGLITGASDADPSSIATYSQAGAGLGFKTLWTALFTFP